MYYNSLHTQKQNTKVDRCGITNKMLELKVVRQTTRRHKNLFPEVQIHQSESYVSVEELVGLESLATRSLELGLFQPHLLSTIFILSTRGQDHARTDLLLPTTTLGASRRRLAI